MTTFALVHGGAHGGWCWEDLVPELEARGHRTVAPDLPTTEDRAGAASCAEVVVSALGDAGDVVVVGHSLGGMCVPVVASMRPVRRMVFLGAMVPVPGRVYGEYLAENPGALTFTLVPGTEPGPAGLSWETARHNFYGDCGEEVARRAFAGLRPQAMTVFSERCPLDEWPAVPSTYILMTGDRAVGNDWSRSAAARIGADLVELAGSHSPFYSRPAELADVLVGL